MCCSVVCSSNEDEMRLRIRRSQLMWKSSCLNVRVGELDDKSVMHRQRQGTLPRYDHHVCSDSGTSIQMVEQIDWMEIITESSYDGADYE